MIGRWLIGGRDRAGRTCAGRIRAMAVGAIAALAALGVPAPAAATTPVATHGLAVTVNGDGTVTGSGIDCPGVCDQTYPEPSQSVVGFGHSGEEGYGATDPETDGWMGLLSADLGATQDNFGVGGAVAAFPDGGSRAGGWTLLLQQYDPPPDLADGPLRDTYTLWFGLNDLSALGGPTHLGPFAQAMLTMISRLDSVAVFNAGNGTISAPGWSTSSGHDANSGTEVLVPHTTDQPLTITVPSSFRGGTIALGFTASTVSASPSGQVVYDVSVDGGAARPYTIDGSTMVTPWSEGNGGALGTVDRLPGLPSGAHRITVSLASASGDIATAFNYWQAEAPLAEARPIIVPLQYQASSAGYSVYEQYGYVPTDASVDLLNETTQMVADQFPANVQTVQLDLGDNLDNFNADQLHPSNAGYAVIAQQALAALSSVTLTATAAAGARFKGWSGGPCSGTGTCTVTPAEAGSVTASFTDPPSSRTAVAAGFTASERSIDGALAVHLDPLQTGRIELSAMYLNSGHRDRFADARRTVRRGSTVTVMLRPPRSATRLLRRGRRLRVRLTIAFKPTGGQTRDSSYRLWVSDSVERRYSPRGTSGT